MKARLRRELMIKKLEVRVAALVAMATTAFAPAPARKLWVDEEDKIIVEVLPKVLSISL